jgi:phage terminase large subunit-like protein
VNGLRCEVTGNPIGSDTWPADAPCRCALGVGAFDLTTGTIVRAIASDASGAAGSNHGFVSYDELWGYVSARSQRLWDEMTPVPTRRNSVRFISTYAGYENESVLLWNLYLQVVDRDEHPDGQGERIHPDLPIFCNREARLFAYWDHEPRLPWQTEHYYRGQRRQLSGPAYLRLHENRWVSSQSVLIPAEEWKVCEVATARPVLRSPNLPVVIGADAATKKDTAAVAAVSFDPLANRVRIVNHAVFKPGPGEPIDLEETVERTIKDWNDRYQVTAVVYDPYQFAVIANHLLSEGIPAEEFPQTTERLTAMSTTFLGLIRARLLEAYDDETIRTQIANAVAVATPRGIRIAKDKARNKIDVVVALAMACHRAVTDPATGLAYFSFTAEQLDAAKAVETEEQAAELAEQGVDPEADREREEAAIEERQRRELWNNPNAWR